MTSWRIMNEYAVTTPTDIMSTPTISKVISSRSNCSSKRTRKPTGFQTRRGGTSRAPSGDAPCHHQSPKQTL